MCRHLDFRVVFCKHFFKFDISNTLEPIKNAISVVFLDSTLSFFNTLIKFSIIVNLHKLSYKALSLYYICVCEYGDYVCCELKTPGTSFALSNGYVAWWATASVFPGG